jgi:aryl-phospho-beta-D-glucosidase BglC (GH1 family)
MMEAYILHAPNFPERKFKREFAAALGEEALCSFEKKFRESFIRESDIEHIAALGFNCVRVPFHYRLVESKPRQYDGQGVRFLDQVVRWAKKHGIWVILDLHAAPGSQNHDWHSDSFGKKELWTKKSNQERTLALWEYLADRYQHEEAVAGYDLLNEAVLDDTDLLNRFYRQLIKRVRGVDKGHILFIEGNTWATDLECLDVYEDSNYVLSVHHYGPVHFVFNLVPGLVYPVKSPEGRWDKSVTRRSLSRYAKISRAYERPVFVGEFGVNARYGLFGEDRWLQDVLKCFEDFGFHWTYWTYKAVKNGLFPDGIYSYVDNPPWVNRAGPLTGWDTYRQQWPVRHRAVVESWHTDRFQVNGQILSELQNALR